MAFFVQETPLLSLLATCVAGYQGEGALALLSGGGLFSMADICVIVLLSSTYSGVFAGTGMLSGVQKRLDAFIRRIGRFPAMAGLGVLMTAVFCNQTIAVMMSNQLLSRPYEEAGANKRELALDLENSCIVLAGIVPWAISCSVPLSMMGVGVEAVPYAFFLFLLPLCYGLTKSHWFPGKGKRADTGQAAENKADVF